MCDEEDRREKGPKPIPRDPEAEKEAEDVRMTEAINNSIKVIIMALGPIPIEALARYRNFMVAEKSRFTRSALLSGDSSLEWKNMFYDQAINKLEALITFRSAMMKLEESRQVMKEQKLSDKLAARLFPEGV